MLYDQYKYSEYLSSLQLKTRVLSYRMASLFVQLAFCICLSAVGCTALSVDDFILFGTANGDAIFFSNDDNTTSISVPVRFPFYDRLFTTIHVRRIDFTCHNCITIQGKLQCMPIHLCVATGITSCRSTLFLLSLYLIAVNLYNQYNGSNFLPEPS